MEIGVLLQPLILHICGKLLEERADKGHILRTGGIGIPAKQTLVLAVYRHHHFRCMCRAPLREQMRDLIILYAHAPADFDPSVAERKIKGIYTVIP